MAINFPDSPANGDSFTSNNKTWVYDGTVWNITSGTNSVADGAITTAKLASDSVTTAKITDANITAAKLASDAVTTAKILDANITTAKIASNAVTTAKILDANVTEAKIESNAVTTGKLGTDVQLGYRNVVINGAMQVAQRGTSTASMGTSGGYFTADRWNTSFAQVLATARFTQSIENDAPTGSGFRKSLKFLTTTASSAAAADRVGIMHIFEGQNVQQFLKGTASAKQFALSFWVKSNLTGTYTVEIIDEDNTRQVSAAYTVSASGTWEKKTIIFPADTTGAFDNDNAGSLTLNFLVTAGTNFTSGTLNTTWNSITNNNRNVGQVNLFATLNNFWQITGVQLEAGAVATPFEFEDFGTTLAKCQRYYFRLVNGAAQNIGACYYYANSYIRAIVHFPTTMRASPSLVSSTGTDYYGFLRNGGIDSFNSWIMGGAPSLTTTTIYNDTEASGTAGQAGEAYSINSSASVAFSAEL